MADSTIVAMGGGGFGDEGLETPLDEHFLSLARATRRRAQPRVCYLPTAAGDAERVIVRFHSAFARRADASHLALFDPDRAGP